MRFASIEIDLTLLGPIMTQSSAVGAFGLDSVLARTRGHFFLAGTLIKGLVRESLEELRTLNPAWPLDQWFGRKSNEEAGSMDPWRGRLRFADFIGPAEEPGTRSRYRIQIDDNRGSVDQGFYQVLEAPFASGKEVKFSGTVRVELTTGETAEGVAVALRAALNWMSGVGAERTVGFGRLKKVTVTAGVEIDLDHLPATALSGDYFNLTLTLHDPLCIPRHRTGTNLFDSEEFIPGAVLRGVMARMTADTNCGKALEDCLHLIRITHALPVQAATSSRPRKAPLSLYQVSGESALRDALLQPDPPAGLIGDPAFDIDWKASDWDRLPAGFQPFHPKKALRVRTAIESEKRKADDNKLFAYWVIPPGQCVWQAGLDLRRVPAAQRPAVLDCLQRLAHVGLWGLGKTKAAADFSLNSTTAPVAPAGRHGQFLCIILESPALLMDPRPLASMQSPASFQRLLQDAWDRQAGAGVLKLHNWFQRNTLAGGRYLAGRFQKDRPYRPYLLTNEGSVFVFEVLNTKTAAELGQAWLDRGLTPWGENFYGAGELSWRNCPYIPENGYGEVRIEWAGAAAEEYPHV